MRLPLLFVFLLAIAAAQQPAPQTPPANDSGVTFSSNAQLVVETVTVKDKSGKSIEGLTEKDFTVTEDNVPQTIRVFEFQKLPDAPVEPPPPPTIDAPTIYNKLSSTQIQPEAPGDSRYRDRRLLALYFDMT